ncbi:Forkhead Box Protein O1 [Manis pentadactyla]|nr:Forkhead Box Protein O1 [Manis pentadactyla]
MLMDALRARRRHPPASHALAVLTSPPASDRLAPAGLSARLGSPAVCGVRQSLWPKRPTWWRSTRISSRCPSRTSASPALPPPAWRRRAARPGTATPLRACLRSLLFRRSAWGSLSPADRIAKAIESSAEKRLPLPRSVHSGPRFRGEADGDGSAGWKKNLNLENEIGLWNMKMGYEFNKHPEDC